MAAFVGKFVAKKFLKESLQNKFGKEDPYFESVPATRLDGKPSTSGRTTKRKKALPPGISKHDGEILTKVKRRAYRLDMCLFTLAGIHFGWGSVIGIIPVAGDFLDAFMAMMVLRTCQQIEGGLPSTLRTRMLLNVIFDFIIGIVPFLGDLADAMFRANTKNAVLLEEHLREKGAKNLRETGQPIPRVDPSDADYYDRVARGEIPRSNPPSREPSAARPSDRMPNAPEATHARQSGGGWFSRSRDRPLDVERGEAAPQQSSQSRRKEQRQHQRRQSGRR